MRKAFSLPKRMKWALVVIPALVFLIGLSLASAESVRGKLYLATRVAVPSPRAGTPCLAGEGAFCNLDFQCPEGQVAKGIAVNVAEVEGKPTLAGAGIVCADPNDSSQTTGIGAVGNGFAGSVYRDLCDNGFFLAGVTAMTTDRRNVSGLQKVCRRYWPVEERKGPDAYGGGDLNQPIPCGDGQFVTGLNVSYHKADKEDGTPDTLIRNLRFSCSEMRKWIGTPEDVRDPRDPEIRK